VNRSGALVHRWDTCELDAQAECAVQRPIHCILRAAEAANPLKNPLGANETLGAELR
jgi:hypothetical protein